MKQLYLHVGAGKTGTSAIQEFLQLNRSRLEVAGMYIPDIGRAGSDRFLFHHELAGGKGPTFDTNTTLELWEEIAQLDCEKLLVSSEIFHSRVKGRRGRSFFYQLRDLFIDCSVKVVFYIRREDQWLESAYEEWIKTGLKRDGESIDEFALGSQINLAEQVFLFAEIFGTENVIVRPYERAQFRGGNIFLDFLESVGVLPPGGLQFPKRNSNPRLSRDALEFKRIVNMVCRTREETERVGHFLRAYSKLQDHLRQELFRKPRLLSLEAREVILAKCEPLYREIAQRFLGRSDGRLFYEELNESVESYVFNVDDLASVVGYILVRLIEDTHDMQRRLSELEGQVE